MVARPRLRLVPLPRASPFQQRRRRSPEPSHAAVLCALLTEPRAVAVEVLEAVATAAHAEAALPLALPPPALLARALGYTVVHMPGAACGQGALLSGCLVVRPHRDAAREGLTVLHELAHALLTRLGAAHSHGDVWLLTLALAVPRGELRPLPALRALQDHAPAWALALRVQIARALAAGR